LIVEDDFTTRVLLQRLLTPYGESHIAVNGREAVSAYGMALDGGQPYDLVCLDIMLPEMDGHAALKEIRAMEELRINHSTHGAKIIMISALGDMKNMSAAYQHLCDGYLVKPIVKTELVGLLDKLKVFDE
jgi:two-component system chemotaxis response regulator CheY